MKKSEQREATIQKLIDIGREIFTESGYANASTEEIVRRAGVTRGALYHHFQSKEGLFRSVAEAIHQEVAGRILSASEAAQGDSWEQLLAGCRAFLAASLDPQVRQILLIDAPAVVGLQVWRQIDEEHSMRLLKEILDVLIREGSLQAMPLDALAHLLSGAMNEAALWITQASDPQIAYSEAMTTLEAMLKGLRINSRS